MIAAFTLGSIVLSQGIIRNLVGCGGRYTYKQHNYPLKHHVKAIMMELEFAEQALSRQIAESFR
ncbi:hypothetical protein J31TS6_47400 [Brevibacillus reuszeri]|uniref:hypothetical protein n=1 Tax=Brevibacillus reuszeri TaxID=54915 RepID=UPI001B042B11|nr:hypothetical protein [Brevibacillus reuszeri]GIO08712.1 hypothetical protein J31TS6_47400 [Brevibacillus reuszeri]